MQPQDQSNSAIQSLSPEDSSLKTTSPMPTAPNAAAGTAASSADSPTAGATDVNLAANTNATCIVNAEADASLDIGASSADNAASGAAVGADGAASGAVVAKAQSDKGVSAKPSESAGALSQGLSYRKSILAVAYYFMVPGITYGCLTSRLPAIMERAHADKKDIGLMLFALGACSIVSLMISPQLIKKYGSHSMLFLSTIAVLIFTIATSYAVTPLLLIVLASCAGFAIGIIDVGMNTQGILIEKLFKRKSMAKLHAFYSLGAVLAAVIASAFAAYHISAHVNLTIVLGFYLLFTYVAYQGLINDLKLAPSDLNPQAKDSNVSPSESSDTMANGTAKSGKGRAKSGKGRAKSDKSKVAWPFLIYVCGIMALLVYAIEGSVGEWGSIFLHQDKGASQSLAALVFGAFSICAVISKLLVDKLRDYVSDFSIMLCGSLLSMVAFAWVLKTEDPLICLTLYAFIGFVIAPIVPITFSIAGNLDGISASDASALVAKFAYAGLLFFPPLLGFLAQNLGLGRALYVVLGQIILVICLSLCFKKRKSSAPNLTPA